MTHLSTKIVDKFRQEFDAERLSPPSVSQNKKNLIRQKCKYRVSLQIVGNTFFKILNVVIPVAIW